MRIGEEYSTEKKSERDRNKDSCKNSSLNKPLWSFERVSCFSLISNLIRCTDRSSRFSRLERSSTTVKSIILPNNLDNFLLLSANYVLIRPQLTVLAVMLHYAKCTGRFRLKVYFSRRHRSWVQNYTEHKTLGNHCQWTSASIWINWCQWWQSQFQQLHS